MLALAVDAQGILFRGKPMCSEHLMAACQKLKVVGRHGAGLDIVDIPAATRLGVAVVHAPGSNSQAVAEHALMLMLSLARKVVPVSQIVFGTDYPESNSGGRAEPIFDHAQGLAGVFSGDDLRAIQYENALKLFPKYRT